MSATATTRSALFWSAGAIDGYQSDAAATVYITQDASGVHISAADPTSGATGTFHLTIPIASRSTTIEIPRNGGRTFTTTLKLQWKRRAVR